MTLPCVTFLVLCNIISTLVLYTITICMAFVSPCLSFNLTLTLFQPHKSSQSALIPKTSIVSYHLYISILSFDNSHCRLSTPTSLSTVQKLIPLYALHLMYKCIAVVSHNYYRSSYCCLLMIIWMCSCENESDGNITVFTRDADKQNIATDCMSPLTSYFYLSLLTNAIWYSAPLELPLSNTDSSITPPTNTTTPLLPLLVLQAWTYSILQWQTDTPMPSAPCFSTGLIQIGLINMVLIRDVLREWVVDRDRNLRGDDSLPPYL